MHIAGGYWQTTYSYKKKSYEKKWINKKIKVYTKEDLKELQKKDKKRDKK